MSDTFTRDEFVKPSPRRYHEFEVELNGVVKTVRIQSLTALERTEYELSGLDERGRWSRKLSDLMTAKLIVMCVVDANGKRVLKDSDCESLMEQDGDFIGAIYDECMEHTGLRKLGVKNLAKNSDGGETTVTAAA